MPFNKTPYKKFFTIKPQNADQIDLRQIDIIQANKELEKNLGGKPNKVSELNDGSLLIEVADQAQSERMSQVQKFNTIKVAAESHKSLNSCKRTIYFENYQKYSNPTLLEELSKSKVIEMNTMRNTKKPNTVFILTFDTLTVPEFVTIGWRRVRVREFIPRARRCFKCQKWGHSSERCRSETAICMNCAQTYHGSNCENDSKCSNCAEPHPASTITCVFAKLEQETLKIQCREKLSYFDSKRKAIRNLDDSYSVVLQRLRNPTRAKPESFQSQNTNTSERNRFETLEDMVTDVPQSVIENQPAENKRKRPVSPEIQTKKSDKKVKPINKKIKS